jgi:tail tube protein
MPESTGKTGRGIKFEMGDTDSPANFTTVANVASISPSGQDAEEIDFTHLLSEGGFREFRQGFKDPGSLGIEFHFDPTNATHTDLLAKFMSGEVFEWRVNFVGAGWNKYWVGRGFVKNPGDLKIDPNSPVGGTATIRITGATSWQNP